MPAISAADRTRFEKHLTAPSGASGLLRADLARGAWLDKLIPEARAEMDFVQKTRYHTHTSPATTTCLEHSLRVVDGVPPVLLERMAALFHDIGKRRTTTIKKSNGDEQYLGHAEAGARMTGPILARLGYDKAFSDKVCTLIYWHMELHTAANNATSAKSQAKLLLKIEDWLPELERLQIADIKGMNPHLVDGMLLSAQGYHRLLAATIADRDSGRTTDCSKPRGQGHGSVPSTLARAASGAERPVVAFRERGECLSPEAIKARYAPLGARSEHPALVVVAGLPASGKTYVAERLVHEAGCVRVSSDDIRMAMTGGAPDYHNRTEIMACFSIMADVIEGLLARGVRVVADSTARVPSERRGNIALGRAAGVPTVLLYCRVDEAEAARRMTKRAISRDEADQSEASMRIRARMADNETPPKPHEADLVMAWIPTLYDQVWAKLISYIDSDGGRS